MSQKPRIAISVFARGRMRHILLNYSPTSSKWHIRDLYADTVEALVEQHVEKKIPVQNDGTCIVSAVPRPDYYILHENIEIKEKLGGGAFGTVHRALLKRGPDEREEVAVKLLKGTMKKKGRREFVKEARIMRKFNHQNVIKLFGVAPQVGLVYFACQASVQLLNLTSRTHRSHVLGLTLVNLMEQFSH